MQEENHNDPLACCFPTWDEYRPTYVSYPLLEVPISMGGSFEFLTTGCSTKKYHQNVVLVISQTEKQFGGDDLSYRNVPGLYQVEAMNNTNHRHELLSFEYRFDMLIYCFFLLHASDGKMKQGVMRDSVFEEKATQAELLAIYWTLWRDIDLGNLPAVAFPR